ncbi:MAG: PAS domain S-box protein [Spirochaetes bacterium]|nr:PAS domain S-box protein [Spirochaetota bacterium]
MLKEFDDSLNILIVTVDPDISNVLNVLLNNLNYNIELINSGSEALKEIETGKYDLMLLDAVLPDMNIVQVLNYIKKISVDTLVIAMLAEISPGKIDEALKSGAYDYLKKPFDKEEINKRVENALNKRRAEKELENIKSEMTISENRNSFIQNGDDIIYTLDYEGRFTSVNNSMQQKLGYDNNSLLRKHFSEIIYPEDLQKAIYIFNERRSISRDFTMTKMRLMRNALNKTAGNARSFITVEVKAKGVYDGDSGKNNKLFIGTYGIARDISEFVRNEEVLKLQKAYFKELFNNSNEATVILDLNSRVLNVNRNFQRLFKYTSKEIKNKYIHDLIIPDKLKNEAKYFSDAGRMMETIEKETVRMRKDGEEVNVIVNGYPIIFNNRHIGSYRIYRDIAVVKQNEEELKRNLVRMRGSMGSIANAMVSTVEVRDPYTVGHQQRVSNLARAIAKEMGLSRDEIDAIRLAGTLHDIGKVNIPAEILSKPGQLSNIELSLIKMHPTIAYEILKQIEFPWQIAEIVYQHHERLDGSGYPRGLLGKDISLSGRILSVADVVESISSHRPYRPALGIKKALEEITLKRNTHYDAKVVNACINLFYEKGFTLESDIPEENADNLFQMPA